MHITYRVLIPTLLIFAFMCAGCLKDKNFDNYATQSLHSGGDQRIIELKVNAVSASNFVSVSFNAINYDTTVQVIPVNLASVNPAPEDIHVTLALDTALISAYDSVNSTDYQAPDPSTYTIINPVVTIPKGQHTGYLMIKFNPANFVGADWAWAFTIKSVQETGYTISGNLASGIYAFGIKNKYDGRYMIDASSSLVDYLVPGNSSVPGDPYPFEVDLITTGANSVAMFIPGIGYAHMIAGGNYYGEFAPVFTFDASGNVISVTNYYGQPSPSRKRAAQLDPSGLNKQNLDQSIDVSYIMTQGGNKRASFVEHLVYEGPR